MSTYNGIIHPVGSQKFWDIPDIVKDHVVLPPIVRRRAGRPKKKRIPSAGEKKRQIKCGRFNESGHNRKRCRNVIPVKIIYEETEILCSCSLNINFSFTIFSLLFVGFGTSGCFPLII